jgi:hypothetical protein
MMDNKFIEGLSALIEKHFGSPKTEEKKVVKSLDEEQRIALFVVLEPQEGDTTTDLHGDTYNSIEIAKACRSFNEHCQKASFFHRMEIEDAEIIESYIAPADFIIDGESVTAGSWVQKWYFPETEIGEVLWQGVKSGEINGVSIDCFANTEILEN